MKTMINCQKLIDTSPSPFDDVGEGLVGEGIITKLQSYSPPWGSLNISLDLDMYYYGNISGNKIISPLVEKLLNTETHVLEDEDLATLAKICYTLYNKKWDRLWEVFQSEYDPTENYNMIESGEETSGFIHGETITRTDNLTHAKTGTETENPNITESRNQTINSNTNDNIYGFNSSEPSPANSGTQQNTNVDTMNRTGSNTIQYNTSDTDTGTETHAHTGTDTSEKEHSLTRHGNIGVTTTQQMLTSEIELWQWDFFTNVLFPDLDRVLTIQIY